VFRQITIRVGFALAPRTSFRVGKPWLIPLLTNASPQLILAGTGASGSWTKIVATLATSVLMSTVTGLIFYWAGWRFGHKLAELAKRPGSPWAGVWNPKQIARAERWMDRWGIVVVFLARATEQFTLPVTLVAGASEMRFRRFVAAHTAGAIAFAGLFVWIGSVAHRRWPGLEHWISHTYARWAFWIGIVLLGVLVLMWIASRFVDLEKKNRPAAKTDPSVD
jgi:membrane protein DedA with SNARE-associated domain